MVKLWQTLSSQRILADRWINLRVDNCLTENGKEIAPYYVLSYPDLVFVSALTPDDELVLVEQSRHGAAATCLEVPGRVIDASAAAANRKLAEETGFAADRCELLSCLYVNPVSQTNCVHPS